MARAPAETDSDLPDAHAGIALEDEHLAATGFFTEVEHPIIGRIRETAVPSEWSGTVPLNRHPAAALGEHTVDVLRRRGSASSGSINWWPTTSYSSGRSCSSGRKPLELISRFAFDPHPGNS